MKFTGMLYDIHMDLVHQMTQYTKILHTMPEE